MNSVHAFIMRHSHGNLGAMTVLSEGYKTFGHAFFDRVEHHGLSGSAVWIVFKDICKQDIYAMMIRISDDTPFAPEQLR